MTAAAVNYKRHGGKCTSNDCEEDGGKSIRVVVSWLCMYDTHLNPKAFMTIVRIEMMLLPESSRFLSPYSRVVACGNCPFNWTTMALRHTCIYLSLRHACIPAHPQCPQLPQVHSPAHTGTFRQKCRFPAVSGLPACRSREGAGFSL